MKKFIFILLGLVFFSLQAQNLPQGISYQAVAIKKEKVNLGGENLAYIYWSKKDIVVRYSIYDTYPNGNVEYSETHDTKTDDYGVFNLIIGKGDRISGNFESINWELGDAHLKIEIDFDGFGAFELIGVEKFWSVPYAFVSKKQSNNNSQSDSLFSDLYGKYDYLRNRDKDTVIGNEGGVSYEYLDSLNRVLLDSIGKLQNIVSRDKDTVIGNEWQDLIKSADSVLITNGSGIKLLDDDSTNEIQDIFLRGDTLFIGKSNAFVMLDSIFKHDKFRNSFDSSVIQNYQTDIDIIPVSFGSKPDKIYPISVLLSHINNDTLYILGSYLDRIISKNEYYNLAIFKKHIKDSLLLLDFKTSVNCGVSTENYLYQRSTEQYVSRFNYGNANDSVFVFYSAKDGIVTINYKRRTFQTTKDLFLNPKLMSKMVELKVDKFYPTNIGSPSPEIYLYNIADTVILTIGGGLPIYKLIYKTTTDEIVRIDSFYSGNIGIFGSGFINETRISILKNFGAVMGDVQLNVHNLLTDNIDVIIPPVRKLKSFNFLVLDPENILMISGTGNAYYWNLKSNNILPSKMYEFIDYNNINFTFPPIGTPFYYLPMYKKNKLKYFVRQNDWFEVGPRSFDKNVGAIYEVKFE